MTDKLYLAPNLNIYEPTKTQEHYSGVPANHSIDLAKWIEQAIEDGSIIINGGFVPFTASYEGPNLILKVGNITQIVELPEGQDIQTLSLMGNELSIQRGNKIALNISNLKLTKTVTINNITFGPNNTLEELIDAINGIKIYEPYRHTQNQPSSTWSIFTGLNRDCVVSLYDFQGNQVYADVVKSTNNVNVINVYFKEPETGYALCS